MTRLRATSQIDLSLFCIIIANLKKNINSHGVPHGSILGPLFLIVFINDFSRASDLLFSILFADDTTVLIEGQNYNNIMFTLNTELQKLDVWLQANKLTLNTAKTHYMIVHRARMQCKIKKKYFQKQ